MSGRRRPVDSSLLIWGGLILLTAAGLALRLKGLNQTSLGQEEAWHAFNAGYPDFLSHWWKYCEHPFGFYLINRLTTAVVGSTLFGARFSALLAGLAAVPLVFLVGRRAAGPGEGLLAAGFTAFSFTAAGFSLVMLPYSLWFLSASVMIWAVLRARERPSPYRLAVLLLLVPLTHQAVFAMLFIQAGAALLLAWDCYRGRLSKGVWTGETCRLAGGYIVWLGLTALALVWLSTQRIVYPMEGSNYVPYSYRFFWWGSLGFWGGLSRLAGQAETLLQTMLPFVGQFEVNNLFVGLQILVAAVGLGDLGRSEKGRGFLILLLGTLLAQFLAMALSLWPILWRQSLYLSPFYYVILARGMVVLGGWMWRARYRLALGLGLAFLAVLPLRAVAKNPLGWPYHQGRPEAGSSFLFEHLKAALREGDVIYTDHHSTFALAFLFLRDQPAAYRAAQGNSLRKEYRDKSDRELGLDPQRLVEVELFGRRVRLLQGGADVSAILQARPERIWVMLDAWAREDERSQVPQALSQAYAVSQRRTFPGSAGTWLLFTRKD